MQHYVHAILDDLFTKSHILNTISSLAIALSGGADSMALALLAQRWCRAHGVALTALTVDHGLRENSAQEAVQVAQWMAAHGIAHHILTPPSLPIANLQSRARAMRYGALTDWCRAHGTPPLLLAHHACDQAETVALQQHRGDSSPSQAGMALVSVRAGILLLRPLLGVHKNHLLKYLRSIDQSWLEDPSNMSDAFARNRLRRILDDAAITALWHHAQTQGAQRHAEDVARNAWCVAHVKPVMDGLALDLSAWRTLADAMRTDLLSRAIRAVGGKTFRPRHHETLRLDAQIMATAHGRATLGHCLLTWSANHGTLHMAREHAAGLDMQARASHIPAMDPWKALVAAPFWWFNYPPYDDGVLRAAD